MSTLDLDTLEALCRAALESAGASPKMAHDTAAALMYAEARGIASHGASRVPFYATHLRNGRADGAAVAAVARERGGAVLVDAHDGLAFPACALAIEEAIRRAGEYGVS